MSKLDPIFAPSRIDKGAKAPAMKMKLNVRLVLMPMKNKVSEAVAIVHHKGVV
jgi:hypothetical protein